MKTIYYKKLSWPMAFAVLAMVAAPLHVRAQTWGDVFGAIIQQGMINNAVKKWNAVDVDVRQCLANSYGLNAGALAQQGIAPDDYRLRGQLANCRNQVAEARAQAEQQREAEERDRLERQQAEEEAEKARAAAAEQAERDRAAAAEAARKEELARQAQAKADAEARHKTLVARFGATQAVAIESGSVQVGMSREAVLEALGRPPDSRQSVPPDDELWVYGSERISISKGRVTYIGH